jgi:hypothetical protein
VGGSYQLRVEASLEDVSGNTTHRAPFGADACGDVAQDGTENRLAFGRDYLIFLSCTRSSARAGC